MKSFARFFLLLCLFCVSPFVSAQSGQITAGAPRIWQYERVYPLIDGLLRDLQNAQLKGLTALDANSTQSTAISLLQTTTQVAATYNQADAYNNSLTQRNNQINQQLQQQQMQDQRNQQLQWDGENRRLQAQLRQDKRTLAAANTDRDDKKAVLDKDTAAKASTDTLSVDQTAHDNAVQKATDAQSAVTEDNAQITNLGTRPTIAPIANPGSVAATDGGDASKLQQASQWDSLPKVLRDQLLQQLLNAPNLPAAKQLDNQITLLRDRMARQLDVLMDDASFQNDTRKLYLMGFDIGVSPTSHNRHQVARVTYTIAGCESARVVQMYPGFGAYNIAEYDIKSSSVNLLGVVKTLVGFGLNVSYARTKENARNGLTQAAYVSGFGSGTEIFGWRFAPAPSQDLVTPGERSVYALVSVPSRCKTATLTPTIVWETRSGGTVDTSNTAESAYTSALPEDRDLTVTKIAYDPRTYDPSVTDSTPKPNTSAGSVLVELKGLIDPELVVTVGGKPLKRVRDWRGRATPVSTSDTINGQKVGYDGLLEADTYDVDTWMSPNPHTVLINLSTDTAGSLTNVLAFPPIRLHTGSGKATDLQDEIGKPSMEELRVGAIRYNQPPFSTSALLPLLYSQPRKHVNFKLGLASNSAFLYSQTPARDCVERHVKSLEDGSPNQTSADDWYKKVEAELRTNCAQNGYAEAIALSDAAVRVAAFDADSGEQIPLDATVDLILQIKKTSSEFYSFACAQLNSLEVTCPVLWSNYNFLDPFYTNMSGRVIAPGIGEGSDNIDFRKPPDVTLSLKGTETGSDAWALLFHTQNLPGEYKTWSLTSGSKFITSATLAQNGDLSLSIPFASFRDTSNHMSLSPSLEPRMGSTSANGSIPINNLRDALSPVVTSMEGSHGEILRGYMLGSVSKIVAGNVTCTSAAAVSVQPSDTSLELPVMQTQGLLKFCIGDYAVPAMYAKDDGTKPAQLYGSLKGTGTDKQFYLAGFQPEAAAAAQDVAGSKQNGSTTPATAGAKQAGPAAQAAAASSSSVDAQATVTVGGKSITATLKGTDPAAVAPSNPKVADSTIGAAASTPPAAPPAPAGTKPQPVPAATPNVAVKKYKRPIVTTDVGNQQTRPQ